MACRSSRSFVARAIAVNSSGRSSVVSATTFPRTPKFARRAFALARRRNAARLWRQLRTLGFRGSSPSGRPRRRRAEWADAEGLKRIPSARTIARLMTIGRDNLSKADTMTIAAIESNVPALVNARQIIAAFHAVIRRKAATELAPWIDRARTTLVASFANGVRKDEAAVRAAIALPWSNGQTEGQITKLKLAKRQMYGRAKIDLPQARLIGAV